MHNALVRPFAALAVAAGIVSAFSGIGVASAAPSDNANDHARAGKITICHSTGSATNPFVLITVSANSMGGHGQHHDGQDTVSTGENCSPFGGD